MCVFTYWYCITEQRKALDFPWRCSNGWQEMLGWLVGSKWWRNSIKCGPCHALNENVSCIHPHVGENGSMIDFIGISAQSQWRYRLVIELDRLELRPILFHLSIMADPGQSKQKNLHCALAFLIFFLCNVTLFLWKWESHYSSGILTHKHWQLTLGQVTLNWWSKASDA